MIPSIDSRRVPKSRGEQRTKIHPKHKPNEPSLLFPLLPSPSSFKPKNLPANSQPQPPISPALPFPHLLASPQSTKPSSRSQARRPNLPTANKLDDYILFPHGNGCVLYQALSPTEGQITLKNSADFSPKNLVYPSLLLSHPPDLFFHRKTRSVAHMVPFPPHRPNLKYLSLFPLISGEKQYFVITVNCSAFPTPPLPCHPWKNCLARGTFYTPPLCTIITHYTYVAVSR